MSMHGIPDAERTSASVDLFGETFCITAATCSGRRRVNQDCFGWIASSGGDLTGTMVGSAMETGSCGLPDFLLAIVCDGLGGMRDGDKASRSVVDGMVAWAASGGLASGDPAEGIVRAATAIEGRLRSDYPRSGTTMSIVAAVGGRWTSAHLGDSRCYAVAENMRWRTKDHSPAENMYQNGLISEDEMKHGPMGSMVSAFIGGDHATELETEEIPKGWDRLVLCSDGAYGFMDSKTFYNLSVSSKDADEVVKIAYDFGSSDNITALVIRYVEMKEMMHLVKGAIFPSRRRR